MKKIFLSMILSGAVLFTYAQTSNNSQGSNTTQPSSTSKKTKNTKNKMAATAASDTLNNRKIYKSKTTGQAATPTGQQATGTNGTHSNTPKNAGKNEE